jgi:hypothetical protein
MELLGVLGGVAFSLACAVVGFRLLRLASRSKQTPELAMGVAFVSSGAVGFTFTVIADALARNGGAPDTIVRLGQAAMLSFYVGYFGLAVGSWRIFRPRESWVKGLVGAIGAVLVMVSAVLTANPGMQPGQTGEIASWCGVATGCFVFGWAGVESVLLFLRLRKRARIGLVEPLILDRVRLWAVGMFAAWAMTVHALGFRLMTGTNQMPDGQRVLSSGFGLVAAVAIWLAFFPPAVYRRRFATPMGD